MRKNSRSRRSRRERPRSRRSESRFGEGEVSGRRGKTAQRRERSSSRRSNGASKGFDWSVAEEDIGREEEAYLEEYEEDEILRPSSRRRRRPPDQQRLSLTDLCTPVFGFAAMLPRNPEEAHPGYEQFHSEVVAALRRIEAEAPKHEIEPEDAAHVCYALSFFMDTQVADSSWNAKEQWGSAPLGIMLQQDPEGGVNFFSRLESFGDRHRAVKEVYLVCLALGFRGKYAEMEPAPQAAKIAEIRQNLLRGIHPEPLDKQPELFPEAYDHADPIRDEVPPPRKWWIFASLGMVVVAFLAWSLLFVWAGRSPQNAEKSIRSLNESYRATQGSALNNSAPSEEEMNGGEQP